MRELTEAQWQTQIEELGETAGYYEPLGKDHAALFVDEGPVLLVTFELKQHCLARQDNQLPKAVQITEGAGWSSLTLIAEHQSWFRTPELYAYFDRLVDDAFFEDFDRVVFYGAGSCGYAAASYSVAAPGATVIAVQPQATLTPSLAGWDDRFPASKRVDFTSRYGFAPDMMDGVGRGFIIYDPMERIDAMHAALFARPDITLLPARNCGPHTDMILNDIGLLDEILERACAGEFSPNDFWTLFRARRDLPRYLRGLAGRLRDTQRSYLEALLCRNVVNRRGGPRFRSRLNQLTEQLAEDGITLPEPMEHS
ncbi:hypothetical protein BFP70_02970 [Thioclava sp. SK-1]|uniref:hypothetical protein n=1 Tax=Thioclava sp. SK-1 TaxID=1889770 RepID=UPI0008250AAD|nr:hypothetical protein [Thioclava sp. SK-1]OCX67138.1 hypothetical protein BFP70_02970 [Thioclava sp. SK-1]